MNGKFRLVQADPAAANTSLLAAGDAEDGALSDEPACLNGELKTVEQALREAEAQPAHAEPVELDRVGQVLRRIDPLWDVLFPAERERMVRLPVEELIEAISRGEEDAGRLPPAIVRGRWLDGGGARGSQGTVRSTKLLLLEHPGMICRRKRWNNSFRREWDEAYCGVGSSDPRCWSRMGAGGRTGAARRGREVRRRRAQTAQRIDIARRQG
jgi:hypothetical protein